jgi:hypothetical protein
MASFRDFLLRFRPVGAPGRPAVPGVPVDRGAELRDELEPLLALLDVPAAQAAAVREKAARRASELRDAGRAEAERILLAARAEAAAVHDRAEAEARSSAAAESARLLSAGETAADTTLRLGHERLSAIADEILARALAQARDAGPGPSAPTEPPS